MAAALRFTRVRRSFLVACLAAVTSGAALAAPPAQPKLSSHAVPLLLIDGRTFRDLHRNGRLDPYEDWRLAPVVRAADLVKRMTLAEKAGLMVIPVLAGNAPFGQASTGYDMAAAHAFVTAKHVSAFSAMTAMSIHDLAASATAHGGLGGPRPKASGS